MLLAAPTGAGAPAATKAATPAAAATVAAATPSVSREGRRKLYRVRNEDAVERWRGDKIYLRVGAGERSAVTQGAARPAGMRRSAAAANVTRGQGDALLGGGHHVGWVLSVATLNTEKRTA